MSKKLLPLAAMEKILKQAGFSDDLIKLTKKYVTYVADNPKNMNLK